MHKEPIARRRGRPKQGERASSKPERVPVGLKRDILAVTGKDPNYEYRFVLDLDEDGTRIHKYKEGGWEFANADDHNVAKSRTYSSNTIGKLVRFPAGSSSAGQYLYLMRIRKEWYEEDKAAIHKELDIVQNMIHSPGINENLEHGVGNDLRPVYYDDN